jgi:pimeloyl-ACP methyl ester carboxylesterase
VLQVRDQTPAAEELLILSAIASRPAVTQSCTLRHHIVMLDVEGWWGTGEAARCGPGMGSKIEANTAEDVRAPLDVTLTDRRRAGRSDYQNAHLIALLRSRSLTVDRAEVDVAPRAQSVDDLAPARAVVVGVSIGAAIWAAIIIAVRYFI